MGNDPKSLESVKILLTDEQNIIIDEVSSYCRVVLTCNKDCNCPLKREFGNTFTTTYSNLKWRLQAERPACHLNDPSPTFYRTLKKKKRSEE